MQVHPVHMGRVSPPVQLTKRVGLNGDAEKVPLEGRVPVNLGEPGRGVGLRERNCLRDYWPIREHFHPCRVNRQAQRFELK